MKVVPLGNRIIVEPIKDQGNGIIVPDIAEMEFVRSRVVAVGPGKMLDNGDVIPIPLAEGDEVVFDSRAVKLLTPDYFYAHQNLACVDYGGVLCKIERDPGEVIEYSRPKPELPPLHIASAQGAAAMAAAAVVARQRKN